MAHIHKYIYGDIPALGECSCGGYRIWDREAQEYKEYEAGEQKNGKLQATDTGSLRRVRENIQPIE